MSININGKDVSPEKALEMVKDDKLIVTKVTYEFKNENRDDTIPLSNEGFDISKEIISELSNHMSDMGADFLEYTIFGSPYVMGRNLRIIIEDAKPDPTWFKRQLIKLGKWLIK